MPSSSQRALQYLGWLSFTHYAYGASLFLLGLYIATRYFDPASQPVEGRHHYPNMFVSAFGSGFWIVLGLFFVSMALATCLSGHYLRHQRHYNFGIAAGVISVPWLPFGTIFAALTFVVLSRPSVRALFDQH